MENQESQETLQARGFDASLKELEELVARLESGRLTLEESMEAYEKGVKLVKFCNQRLQAAERKVELLNTENPEENPEWKEYKMEDN
ncbi:MAG: exodeoxyribonuclease VII small subunit [Victivallales bacterium]|nr:exodeoxyribonuclease VII small subunit [Victivallales bacterium]